MELQKLKYNIFEPKNVILKVVDNAYKNKR